MSSRDPMPSSAAVRLCSSLMVRRGARLGTAPGATLSASCPAWSNRFVVCNQTSCVSEFQDTAGAVPNAKGCNVACLQLCASASTPWLTKHQADN